MPPASTPVLARVCVFCGSSSGTDPRYAEAAAQMGSELARRGIGLVYGGGSVGLMGVVADAVLAAGGEVTGVIPGFLHRREVAHGGVDDLRVVGSMHDRKALMADLADAFVALPGGIGTFEELFEALTWTQLGVHDKPVALLDVGDFWAPVLALLDRAVDDGFLRRDVRASVIYATTPADVLEAFTRWQRPDVGKWIDLDPLPDASDTHTELL